MQYFNDSRFSEDERRNTAFQIVNAIREAINLGRVAPTSITYENALDIIEDIDREMYTSFISLLSNKNESDKVKLYKEIAETLSTVEEQVTPLELIQRDLDKMSELSLIADDKRFIKKELFQLKAAKEYFLPRTISEHKILEHDFYLAERDNILGKPIYQNSSFKDYKLTDKNILRLRLAHPDKIEEALGADLIYEQFDLRLENVRFVHLQYKMWNNNTLYLNDDRLNKQIKKMEGNLCKSGYCMGYQDSNKDKEFRFPYCSGFIRPTTKILNSENKLVSTGIHIPICFVIEKSNSDHKLTKENCQNKSISYKIFEELFHSNMLGSRWIKIKELEHFYEQKGIGAMVNNIRVHAQEIRIQTEEEKFTRQ
jgi:hypothetical protein